jgi:uncharacterized protein DUF1996
MPRMGRVALVSAVALAAAAIGSAAPFPNPNEFPGGSYFAVICSFSHRNNDDPIVYPGQPGRSHNHTYMGNRDVHAFTTASSLRGGETTCETPGDASAYWVPTLFVRNEPIIPLAAIAYYVKHTIAPVQVYPPGLKMIAGNPNAKKAQSKRIVAWSCGGIGGRPRYTALPACTPNGALELRVQFPNCWNGKTLDSPDHRRHMAYSTAGRCPDSHPVPVATLEVVLVYPPSPGGALASGRFGGHADFINAWEPNLLAFLVTGLNLG